MGSLACAFALAAGPPVGGLSLAVVHRLIDAASPRSIRDRRRAVVEAVCQVFSVIFLVYSCIEIAHEVLTGDAYYMVLGICVALGVVVASICMKNSGRLALLAAMAIHASAEGVSLALVDPSQAWGAVTAMAAHNLFEGAAMATTVKDSFLQKMFIPLVSHASQWIFFLGTRFLVSGALVESVSAEIQDCIKACGFGCICAALLHELVPQAYEAVRGAWRPSKAAGRAA